uniref:Notch receptor 3 n=1 Tax=Sphenodon punctatus TaxID=8508 RepID=A0A8D0G7V2_SPHPU
MKGGSLGRWGLREGLSEETVSWLGGLGGERGGFLGRVGVRGQGDGGRRLMEERGGVAGGFEPLSHPLPPPGQDCSLPDACANKPCANGGRCTNWSGRYNCTCPPGYQGRNCRGDVDECRTPGLCQHAGTCLNTPGSFRCQCQAGYMGPLCESVSVPCAPSQCLNGGTCRQTGEFTYECACLPGEKLVGSCPGYQLRWKETITPLGQWLVHPVSLPLPAGFEGQNCEINIDDCPGHKCMNGGTCVDGVNTYNCQCPPEWTGQFCTEDVDECQLQPNACHNGGTCFNTNGGHTCVCVNGWMGESCSENIDDCATAVCFNGATCHDRVASFYCACPMGKTGTRWGRELPHGQDGYSLGEGAQCDLSPLGGRTDIFPSMLRGGAGMNHTDLLFSGFEGPLCERNVDDCSPDPCHHGTCLDGIASFTCSCTAGYTGYRCENQINECHSNPCQHGGKCIDLNGFHCLCPEGWAGTNCDMNRNECESNPCQHGGSCTDYVNGYRCKCKEGFQGTYCQTNIDDCASGPCLNQGTCIDGIASYTCLCDLPYTGSMCQIDIDECASTPCQNGAKCVDRPNAYECRCTEGERLGPAVASAEPACPHPGIGEISVQYSETFPNSENCWVMELATWGGWGSPSWVISEPGWTSLCPRSCRERGSCLGAGAGLDGGVSVCDAVGRGDPRCHIDINECDLNPCRNWGTCANLLGSYSCACRPGYTGTNCETDIDDCAPNPCLNGGSCQDSVSAFSCTCLPGFTGLHCAAEINECLSSPCRNGATCTDYVNSYTCSCAPGWAGLHCEHNIQECTDSSCFNGGTCLDGVNAYTCRCRAGFTGSHCQYEIDECQSQPCLNGGVCQDGVESFRCSCPQGYTGAQCQTLLNLCSRSPCQNGGRCAQTGTALSCECPGGWTGRYCDIPNVSCDVVAKQRGTEVCHYGGRCVDAGNTHYCICKTSYTGSYCESEVNHCQPSVCRNGGTCRSFVGGYLCECPAGFEGKNCDYDIDECQSRPCQNGGSCIDLIGRYICSCPPGTLGVLCEINEDDCSVGSSSRVPKCLNNGTCVDRVGGYRCNCPPGYTGERCEGDINECLSEPCHPHNTLDCVQETSGFQCLCKPGYTGRHCQSIVNACELHPCQNGGQCKLAVNMPLGYTCHCPSSYSGLNCERNVLSCRELTCSNGGSCRHSPLGARCSCMLGWTGLDCRVRANSSCASLPCQNGGACRETRSPPYYQCLCLGDFTGSQCQAPPPQLQPPPRVPQPHCPREECTAKAGDGYCDKECNTPGCKWDGGDCSLLVGNPWEQCETHECYQYFNNSQCDEVCNSPQCLYDNFDCRGRERTCNPVYEKYCSDHFADGKCDYGCNTEECGWDGLDCAEEVPEHLADGVLVVIVLLPPEELIRTSTTFLQKLSAILRTSLRFRLDENGNCMIQPYYGPGHRHRRELAPEVIGSEVTLEIDNRLCFQASDKCFPDTQSAADYLAALSAVERLEFPYTIKAVHGEKVIPEPPDPLRLLPLVVVAGVILLVILVLGVLVARRKREHSTLWFPEGFTLKKENSNKNRREPVGQDALGMKSIGKGESLIGDRAEDWLSAECPEAKRLKVEEPGADSEEPVDCRQWTQHHLVAADIRMPPSMALTPPQGEFDSDCMDVNVRGPDGFTPLMLASFCGGGVEMDLTEEEEVDESSANIISDLICQGANLSAQTDRTGETALHLAARYARADAAKRLLDAGADTNAQDNTGRTPLHAAVTADAQGVFQILIRNRSTDLDARMGDGSTALILAARLAVEGMVEELIACHADVNAVDELGKSALHWAAAVNNMEATIALLKNGANKDMQDSKEETPLFLAAREGSYEAAKILLDHFANREITDHMDRLPRDVAQERLHHDIVRLLDDYNTVRSPQGVLSSGHTLSPLMCPPNSFLPGLKPTPQGKKSRRPSAKSVAAGSSASLAREGKEGKGRGKKLNLECQGALLESSVTLSPVDSLDSPYMPNPASPGVFHATSVPSTPMVHGMMETPFAVSLARLSDLGDATLLSMNRLSVPPGRVGLSLGMVSPVAMPFDWHTRVPTSQCQPVIGVVHPAASHPNLHQPGPAFAQGLLLSNHMALAHSSQQALPTPAPAKEPAQPMPPPAPAMRAGQPVSPAEAQGATRPGQPQYLTGPGVEDYPTPPSQHSYTQGQDVTPKHFLHPPSEHPYLTPSPESPEQWGSPSPHSLSDWSESTPSPVVLGPSHTQLSGAEPPAKMQVFA